MKTRLAALVALVAWTFAITATAMNAQQAPPPSTATGFVVTTGTPVYSTSTTTGVIFSVGSHVTLAPAVGSYRQPEAMITCSEDACTAIGQNIDKVRAMLDRIADRGIKIDVIVDQNCQPQRETIAARERQPDVVAAR